MKMSAWIRFCLIVLCLAMACSMFACKGPEEQTTESPVVDTTEAPSDVQTTEKPTEKPTETTPIEVTTEEPVVTTEPTEVTTEPTEVTTEPTEVTTEPTEVTTEPTEVTTEAPATETTEVPATETTETTTTETEEVTNTYLEEETVVIGDIGYVEEAASPYACTIDSHGGALGQTFVYTADPLSHVVSGIKGWIAIRPGILKYVYAVVVDGVQGEWVDVTKEPIAYATGTVGYDRSDVITHIANNLPGFESGIAGTNCGFNFTHVLPNIGQYHGKDVSIVYYAVVYKVDGAGDRLLDPDGNGQEGAYIHMATLLDVMPEHYGVGGYRDNGDGTHSIKCEGCDVYYITEKCDPTFGSGATAKDTNTHTGMTCGLCGQTGVEGAHSAPANNVWDDEKGIYTTYYNDVVWDEEQGKYISVCIACGGQAGDAFGAVLSVELENLNIGQPSWATSQSNEETYTVITMGEHMSNGSPSGWKAAYFKVNPNGLRTGQYVALRYMIPEGSNATTLGFEFVNVTVDVPVIADGEWHIVIVELPGKDASYAIPAGDTRLNFNNARGWKQGDQIYLDWFKTYDSIEALNLDLQIGQEDCACPAWAIEVVDYAGVESHSVRCTICGREDTAAHTPSSTRGVAVEGGYVKACTVCGGATAEPAMGNYVFDADALATLTPAGGNENKEITENGVKFSNPGNVDSFLSVFSGNNQTIGKYFFIKYRSENLTQPQFYMWRDGGVNANHTPSINNDGEWHIAVVECDATNVSQLRIDVERLAETTGIPSIEIAYLGYADNAITLAKTIDALDSGADDICECPALFAIGNYVDEDTHAPVCQLCGETGAPVAHAGAKYGAWNEEHGYYVSNTECTTCGELYNFGATVKMQSSNIWGSASSWNISLSYTNGTWLLTKKNDAGVWAESHLKINPDQVVTGQYMIIKYKANGHTGTFNMPYKVCSLKSGTTSSTTLPFVFDGAEHVIILDLSTLANYTANDDGTYSYGHVDSARMTWSNLPKGANIEFTSIAMYDHVDRLPAIPEADCPHTVKVSAIIDAESHGVRCATCNKTFSTEEHVWSSTDCATVLPTCSCGAEKEELGHTLVGSNEEYCATCKTFVNGTDGFIKFIGGANVPAHDGTGGGAAGTTAGWSDNGYRFFTKTTGGETYIKPSFDGTSETGNFMVLKFKATGSFNFEFFTGTSGTGATGSGDNFGYTPDSEAYGTWRYLIVDLTQKVSKVTPDEDGSYSINYLRFDIQGEGTAEIAYLAYSDSLENMLNAINTLEGMAEGESAISADTCGHGINGEALPVYIVIGDGSGMMWKNKCALCGEDKAGKAAVAITQGNWNDQILDNEAVENGKSVGSGWVSVPGGWHEAQFTITNANNPEETTVVVLPISTLGYDHDYWPAAHGAAEDRRQIGVDLTIADWANVNGIDFTGKQVTISLKLVLKKDPTAPAFTWRIANVGGKNEATVIVPSVEPVDPATCEHVGSNYATWNETAGAYLSNEVCSICGTNYDLGASYFVQAESGVIRPESGWGTWGSVGETSVTLTTQEWATSPTWRAVYFNFNTEAKTIGKYIVMKYRTSEGATITNFPVAGLGFQINNDGEWHYAIAEASSDAFTASGQNNLDRSTMNWSYGDSLEIDFFAAYDSLDRIPDYGTECAHGVSAPDAVWTVVGDGTATETAACAVCGEAGATTRTLSTVSSWGDKMYSDNGSAVLENGLIMKGWTLMTGGVLRGEFVITDGENTVTVVYDITTSSSDVATQGSNKYAYMGEDRGYSRYQLEIEDWSNVQGVDFTGKQITITAYAVSKADPTVKIKTVSARPATVAAATEATE